MTSSIQEIILAPYLSDPSSHAHTACSAQRPAPGSPPRYSFPLLFDFAWNAKMQCISLNHLPPLTGDEEKLAHKHWASTTFRQVEGTRAQDLARKVQKVFTDQNLPDFEPNSAFDEVQEGDQSIEL